ncbi:MULTISPECIES: hypothetical protein [Streptomyces]|uniref:Glycosyl hydrolase family 32 N-terminal domain-containing protein n=1 Tax=Streptomyces dengpaensis TaxID=2049881 RepID=A0ABN5I1J3_9ACTN|nr:MULTISPECIES: hypothetical protein [Streptomyces]AVH57250.1 hypothetical protein C4B68_17345 [Streptomyces dengpaensis]PIB03721.1 hypothetical protein B1C81_36080 [Streptomyces sp. HG99]
MIPLSPKELAAAYSDALTFDNPLTAAISTDQFSASYSSRPAWALGPFTKDDSLTFRPTGQWNDPTGIGWTSSSIFNPSAIVKDSSLHLFYRASPRKESTASRIGLAINDGSGWVDFADNPIIFPTRDNELLSCEDPKVYAAEGRYFMFYNGIWSAAGSQEQSEYPSPGYPVETLGCDINVAVSDDLLHWEKLGLAVPYEVSRLWAKGAVIPRNPNGEAVKIDGQYLMYLSEGCNGIRYVGRSTDMINWTFEPQQYLDLTELGGTLYEVACAVTEHDESHDLVLDFFYSDENGDFAAAQALFSRNAPFTQRALNRGGSLAWGGLTSLNGTLAFAQGWDSAPETREMFFYRTVAS